jgi:hypothetical protein
MVLEIRGDGSIIGRAAGGAAGRQQDRDGKCRRGASN